MSMLKNSINYLFCRLCCFFCYNFTTRIIQSQIIIRMTNQIRGSYTNDQSIDCINACHGSKTCFDAINYATLFSTGSCNLIIWRAKMACVVAKIIEQCTHKTAKTVVIPWHAMIQSRNK